MNKKQNYNIISSFIIILSITLIVFIAWHTIDILLLTFAAILLAIVLRTLNNLIQRIVHLPEILSMLLVIGIIITIVTLMIILMIPIISDQIQNLSKDIPNALDKLNQILTTDFPGSSIYRKMDLQNLFPQGKNFLIEATNLFSTTFGLIGSMLVVIIMSIFLAYDPNTYKEGFISLIPSSKQKNARNIIESIANILQWWIVGKMISMIIVGILTTLGLWFLSIPTALILGLLAAVLTFIPNIGPIISVIPAILVAFIQSPIFVIYVIALYIAIQTIESYIMTPLIQGKIIAQPPALVIFSQLIMGLLTGFLGLSLATPLLAVLSIIIKKVYIEKHTNENKYSEKAGH